MFQTLGAMVNHLFGEAENCQTEHPCAVILLSSIALEATLYRKLVGSEHVLKHLFGICNLEGAQMRPLIEYARRLGLLDKTNRKIADDIREIRNYIVHPTNRNLKRLAKKYYPSIFQGLEISTRSDTPSGEDLFRGEASFVGSRAIERLSMKVLKDTESILKFIDEKKSTSPHR